MDPVPDPLLFRKSGRAGNRTRDLWIFVFYCNLMTGKFGTGEALLSAVYKSADSIGLFRYWQEM
jgi:hypothetical protein